MAGLFRLSHTALLVAVIGLFSFATPHEESTVSSSSFGTGKVLPSPEVGHYRVDADKSKFIVKAFAGGFLSALAHDHTISIGEFSGETNFTYGSVEPASLQLTIKAASLSVIDKISDKDRQKIETTMRDEVLETSKFPEITFKSTAVSASKTGEGQYQAKITGDVTLHGVEKQLIIPAQLSFGDKELRAKGNFSLKQSAFGIKPVSVAGGTIKVKDELKFTFDILAHP